MNTRIFLIRHGTTAANLNNIFAGRTDEPLHDQGREQLMHVSAKLAEHGISHIYCGPLNRTRLSAEIIKGETGAPMTPRAAFNEIDIAHWDGLTKDEIREQFGPQYPTWLETPDKFSVPGCETLAEVQTRAVLEINKVLANHPGKNVAVVSHLIVVRCLALHYLDMPISDFRSIKISNASITELVQDDNGKVEVVFENQLSLAG